MPDTFTIPEMQRVKEKYPVYKDIGDDELLTLVARKYPVYKTLATKYQGGISQRKPDLNDVLGYQSDDVVNHPIKKFITGTIQGQFLNRPMGAIHAAIAAKNPIEGFKRPDEQPSTGDSFVKAYNLDPTNAGVQTASAVISAVVDTGIGYMAMGGALSKAAHGEALVAARNNPIADSFIKKNSPAIKSFVKDSSDKIHPSVKAYLQKMEDHETSKILPPHLTDPGAYSQAHQLGLDIEHTKPQQTYALWSATQGKVDTPAATQFGQLIRDQMIKADQVPLHPSSEGRLAAAALVSKTDIATRSVDASGVSLPPYKDTPEINAVYIKHEASRTDAKTVPIASIKTMKKISPKQAVVQGMPVKNVPPMVDEKMNLVDGEHRVELAKLQGKKKINVVLKPKPVSSKIEKAGFEPRPQQKFVDVEHPITKVEVPPVQPEEVVRNPNIADEALQRQGNQPPETIAEAKKIQAEPSPEIVTPESISIPPKMSKARAKYELDNYGPDKGYEVTYKDATGVHTGFMLGPKLRELEQKGQVLRKFGFDNEKGQLNLEGLTDVIANFHGDNLLRKDAIKSIAKKFSSPYGVASKYPTFGKVFSSINDHIALANERFYVGAHLLNKKFHMDMLSPAEQDHVSQVLDLGDSKAVGKYFSTPELIKDFDFNSKQIAAYKSFEKGYNYGLQSRIASLKKFGKYDEMRPEAKAEVDKTIEDQVKRLGGYISHTRLKGKWAVYAPPKEGEDLAQFFHVYTNYADAQKEAAKWGVEPYAKQYTVSKGYHKHITIGGLESLAQGAEINSRSSDMVALYDELRSRSFSSHWTERKWIPGKPTSLEEKFDAAHDYIEGAVNQQTKFESKEAADKILFDNEKYMTGGLRDYTQKYLDTYFHSGADGQRAMSRLIYAWDLGAKFSALAQHASETLATTLPYLTKEVGMVEGTKIYHEAEKLTYRYMWHKALSSLPDNLKDRLPSEMRNHGLSTDLYGKLDKLLRQEVTGGQLTDMQLGISKHAQEGFFNNLAALVGLPMKFTEMRNRVLSAIAGHRVAALKGITDHNAVFEHMRSTVNITRFPYGKQNIPLIISGAGEMRNFLRNLYVLRGYKQNDIHFMTRLLFGKDTKNYKAFATILAGTLGLVGIQGLPFMGLGGFAYKKMTGRVLDTDMREAMSEAHIPNKIIDLSLHGSLSAVGIDASQLIGLADLIDAGQDAASSVFGAPYGFFKNLGQAGYYAANGEKERALEYASPLALRSIYAGHRYAVEGLRKTSAGYPTPIYARDEFKRIDKLYDTKGSTSVQLAPPSLVSGIIRNFGFRPLQYSKAQTAEEAKRAFIDNHNKRMYDLDHSIARSLHSRNHELASKIKEQNRMNNSKLPRDMRIQPNERSINRMIKALKGSLMQ